MALAQLGQSAPRRSPVARKLPSNTQLERQVLATVRTADALLRQAIGAPDGHQWSINNDLLCVTGGPLEAWDSGVSFCIRKTFAPAIDPSARMSDPDQVAVEICLFLPEQEYVTGQRVGTFGKHHGRRFGARLTVKSGSQWAGQCTDHLDESNRRLNAETLEGLVDAIAKIVNAALPVAAYRAANAGALDQPR